MLKKKRNLSRAYMGHHQLPTNLASVKRSTVQSHSRTIKRISVSRIKHSTSPTHSSAHCFPLCDNFWFSETQIAKCQKTTTQPFWKHSHPREGFMLGAYYPAQEGCLQLPSAWSRPSGYELRFMLLNSQWEELRFTVSTLRYSVIPSGHGECPCSWKTSTSGSILVQETWPMGRGLSVSVASSASS